MPALACTLSALAPVLIVDNVAEAVRFWSDTLGFTVENEVPAGDGTLVFASVRKDGVEIMYQSRQSVLAENPAAEAELNGRSVALFITVPSIDDLDAIEDALRDAPVVKPRHTTFYGTTELYVREASGNTVGFSARAG